jgi:hypothetical protein
MKTDVLTSSHQTNISAPVKSFWKSSAVLLTGWTVLVVAFLFQFARLAMPH